MFFTERLASLIAPSACLLCLSEGAVLCSTCSATTLPAAPGCCYVCLTRITNGAACPDCLAALPFTAVTAACTYKDAAEKLVHEFKFSHKRGVAKALAAKIAEGLPPMPPGTVVTHVPTAARRKRERGYDQAALLAQALARHFHLPHVALLERVGNVRQVGAKRTERRQQLTGVFRPLKPYVIQDSPILLIDDVLTTGSTLEAAARVLLEAKARSVNAAVFAQAL